MENCFNDATVAVIGLGYVGLPLAVTFAKTITTIGFDLNESKIVQLTDQMDVTGEVSQTEFATARHLTVTADRRPSRKRISLS